MRSPFHGQKLQVLKINHSFPVKQIKSPHKPHSVALVQKLSFSLRYSAVNFFTPVTFAFFFRVNAYHALFCRGKKIDQFQVNVPLLYLLKTSKNLWLFYVFRGHRNRTLAGNGLTSRFCI